MRYFSLISVSILAAAVLLLSCNRAENAVADKEKADGTEMKSTKSQFEVGETYLITGSQVKLAGADKSEPLITKQATLSFNKLQSGETELRVSYSWWETGWDLAVVLPEDYFGIENMPLAGSSRLWLDEHNPNGLISINYPGTINATIAENEDGGIRIALSGYMLDSFDLEISGITPLEGELEREEALVIVEFMQYGKDFIVNETDKDMMLTVNTAIPEKAYEFSIPANGTFEVNTYEDGFMGLSSANSITLSDGTTERSYSYGENPFSRESAKSELHLQPYVFDGILANLKLCYMTYTIVE